MSSLGRLQPRRRGRGGSLECLLARVLRDGARKMRGKGSSIWRGCILHEVRGDDRERQLRGDGERQAINAPMGQVNWNSS